MEDGRERAGGRVAGSLASPATRARYAPRGEAPVRRTWTRTRSSTTVSAPRASSMSGTPFLTARARQSSCLPATRSCTAPCAKTPRARGKRARRLPVPTPGAASVLRAGAPAVAGGPRAEGGVRAAGPKSTSHSAGEGRLHVAHGSRPSLLLISRVNLKGLRAQAVDASSCGTRVGLLLPGTRRRAASLWRMRTTSSTPSSRPSSEQPARVGAW